MSVYDLRVKKLALQLLPTFWRRPLMAAFAQSLVQGVNKNYGDFMRWRNEEDYRLAHNGQVCKLRGLLNDAFDPQARRITVEDAWDDSRAGQLVYCRETGRHILLGKRGHKCAYVINRRGFGGANGMDFCVNIPLELRGMVDEVRLNAMVNTYKLASKRWTIHYF